jgi:hypothetical protein
MLPADVRFLGSKDLFVSQAALTGEAMPVEKYDTLGPVAAKVAGSPRPAAGDPLDQPTLGFMGTNVLGGSATAVVVATGRRTYFGSLTDPIPPEHRRRAGVGLDRRDHGGRDRPAVLPGGGGARNGGVAVGLLLVAGRDPPRLLRTHPGGQGLVSSAVRIMALAWRV